jgi:hypothetical protein
VVFIHQNCFAVNDFNGALMASGGALAAAGTFFRVDFDDCFFHILFFIEDI